MSTQRQAAVIGNLDIQPRPGVEFQNQRAFFLVQDHVDPDVAQAAQLMTASGEFHETVPVGQLHAIHCIRGVRVFVDDVVQPGAAQGQAGGQVHADTDGALVQVGLAIGLARRQAQHGHHRVTHQNNDANVRHAFIADALEDLVRNHAVFDQRPVAVTAQGVQAGQDAGNLVLDFLMADDPAGHRAVTPFKAVGDHQDAITASALGRFDHEVTACANDLFEIVDFLLGGNHAIQLGHMDAGGNGAFLGDDLVIDDRVQAALVVLEHVVCVAPIDPHDAPGFQGLPGLPVAEHQASAFFRKALKRTSSVRR
ncbi:hypothetical protein D3C87_1380650 [compost metagenome]